MGIAVIEYYIDGSAKENTIGAGIVKINEYGFIEKHHFTIEHTNPASQIAEGYALEKSLEMIRENDIHKNELVNIYTDCKQLITCLAFNQHIEFHRSEFFSRQEMNGYFQYLRDVYKELIVKKSKSCIYHCIISNEARPLIKVFYKEDAENKNYLQEAHSMSRKYIKKEELKIHKVDLKAAPKAALKSAAKVEPKIKKIDLKAVKKANSWHIVKNNSKTIAVNKRPLIALSEALLQTKVQNHQIKLCVYLENLLKSTNKNKLSNESMISAFKIIDEHKNMFVS